MFKGIDDLVYWIRERESIRVRKERGDPPPWTDDPILGKYRFCNVVRMDDRVSRWLLTNWYGPYRDHPNMLAAVALARFMNRESTLSPLRRFVFRKGLPDWKTIRSTMEAMPKPIFGSAYMIYGDSGCPKIESVVERRIRPMIAGATVDTSSMQATHESISAHHGCKSFMAGQMVADLRWGLSGTWADRNDWAPLGPGSRRGMNRILGRSTDSPLSQEEFVDLLNRLRSEANGRVGSVADRMEAIDWQNCLCETDKYLRTLLGEGRPKQGYQPCSST